MHRPSLFIGSSSEGLAIAYAIQENLEFDCDATVWPQGVFQPSSAALIDLYAFTRQAEFALFVFSPDDILHMRGDVYPAVRDNVIFELGLFVGALGPQRCFFVTPYDVEMHLPSDLVGIDPLRYRADRHDGNLRAALGPACNKIRQALRAVPATLATAASTTATILETPTQLAQRLIASWNAEPFLAIRTILKAGIPFHISDDDEEGVSTKALTAAFNFLNSVADGVLSGQIDQELAFDAFAQPVVEVWKRAFGYFAPPGGDPEDAWNPLPPLGALARQWASTPA